MKLSNLRIEDRTDDRSYLIADITCGFSETRTMWFSVQREYRSWLSDDVFDAFLTAVVYPAVYYGEEIEIEGTVTSRIFYNTVRYVLPIVMAYTKKDLKPDVKLTATQTGAFKVPDMQVGTGFSGGVDSFTTIYDNLIEAPEAGWKLTSLFFFNIGQNGRKNDPCTSERIRYRWQRCKSVADELRLNAVFVDSNIFDFYHEDWEYDAGVLCRLACVQALQRALCRYYISSAVSFVEYAENGYDKRANDLASYADPVIIPLLSPDGTDIVCDGAQYTRTQKIERIASWPLVVKYLNVCVAYTPQYVSHNCGGCPKCLKTMAALESMGLLQQYAELFDIEAYRRYERGYKMRQRLRYNTDIYAKDNVDFAARYGRPFPDTSAARRYMRLLWFKTKFNNMLIKLHLKS